MYSCHILCSAFGILIAFYVTALTLCLWGICWRGIARDSTCQIYGNVCMFR